jgi:cob(I)alamin adenosyltransferase
MNCAAALASPVSASGSFLTRDDVDVLEAGIDRIEQRAERARGFVLPSGCEASVRLHLARTVVRRAEREVVALAEEPGVAVDANVLAFLNRLSDLLFAAAGAESEAADVAEEVWNRHAVPPGL